MFETLRLKHFCYCCSTRTGSLVIGTLGWIFSGIHGTQVEERAWGGPKGKHESTSEALSIRLPLLAVCLSIALIFGVCRKKRKFMLPWLVLKFVELIFLVVLMLVGFFGMFLSHVLEPFATLFIIFLIIILITTYCWLCVWSLYMDLGEIQETHITQIPQIPQLQQNPLILQIPLFQHIPQNIEMQEDTGRPYTNKIGFEALIHHDEALSSTRNDSNASKSKTKPV